MNNYYFNRQVEKARSNGHIKTKMRAELTEVDLILKKKEEKLSHATKKGLNRHVIALELNLCCIQTCQRRK